MHESFFRTIHNTFFQKKNSFTEKNKNFLTVPIVNNSELINYKQIDRECEKNSVVMKCIKFIGENIQAIKFNITYINNNNLEISIIISPLTIEKIATDMLLYGKSYIYIKKNHSTITLHNLCIHNIQEQYKNNKINKYIYSHGAQGELWEIFNDIGTFQINSNNIIVIKNPGIIYNDSAFSITKSGFNSIKTYNNLYNWISNIANRGGVASGILSVNNLNGISENNFHNKLSKFANDLGDPVNIMIAEGGTCSWQNIGLTPDKIEINKLLSNQTNIISGLYGIPPLLLGITENNNIAQTYIETRNIFLKETIYPLGNKIFYQLREQLIQFTGIEINFNINWDHFFQFKIT